MKNYHDITLALAGICQSTRLVQQLAHEGQCDQDALRICFNSVYDLNPGSTLAVYSHHYRNLRIGLETLYALLKANPTDPELMRYLLNLIILERKLNASKTALNTLGERIQGLQRQLEHFPADSDTLITALAAIYTDVISPLGPRIQITGNADILRPPLMQSKVRATLLAGIRSAVLWRQVGGGRLQLVLSRKTLIRQAKDMLAHCL